MKPSKIKAKLEAGEPVLITHLGLADASLVELASLMGFDGLWIDFEHHGFSLETGHHLMRAARVGTADVIARPAKGEFMRMGRLLEAGAQGIMYPRCDDAAEAAEVVKWAKFPPLGRRGLDGGNPDAPYCTVPTAQYIERANRQTFIIIQVEEQHAVDNAHEMARIEGVDVLFLGPNDFAALNGVPGQTDHPIVKRAIRKLAEAAGAAGKAWGTICNSPAHARELMDMGATFLAHGADIVLIRQAYERIQKDFQEIGFRFENRWRIEAEEAAPEAGSLARHGLTL
ncbi:MAG TPA: aldolase/citrate lyase family protein [Phycisphaerae bacterium]|nr:aldolase/citrate lyase family protein [Phycisphaerae bacterium]